MDTIIDTPSTPVHWNTQLLQLALENEVLHSFFQKIIDAIPGYLYWKNEKGVYLGCNHVVLEFYRVNSNMAIIGKNDAALCPQYATALETNDRKVMQTDEIIIFEETVLGSTSRSLKMPLKNVQGNIIGVIGHSIDITELKSMKKTLIETREIAEAAMMLYKDQSPFSKPDFFF